MSRYKYECYDHLGLCELKTKLPDMTYDFKIVSSKLFGIYAHTSIEDSDLSMFHEISKKCSQNVSEQLEHFARLYITIEYIFPVLVMIDVDQSILSHLVSVCSMSNVDFDMHLYCPILWVFEGQELTTCQPLTLSLLSQLLVAFSIENLISRAELRDRWIHLPKRDADSLSKKRRDFPEIFEMLGL